MRRRPGEMRRSKAGPDTNRAVAGCRQYEDRAHENYAGKHNAVRYNFLMRFLNRHDEMHRLDGVLSRPGAFAVVWGRRRVGKSRLLIEWSRRHDGLYAVADQSAPPVQRRYLAGAVAERFPGFAGRRVPGLAFVPDAAVRGSRTSRLAGSVRSRRAALPPRRGPRSGQCPPELVGPSGAAADTGPSAGRASP